MKEMFDELKKLLDSHIGIVKNAFKWRSALQADEILYFESIKTDSNLTRILLYTALVFLIQISNIAVDTLTNPHPQYAVQYFTCNIFLGVICGIYFFIALYFLSKFKLHRALKLKKIIYISFWFAISAATLLFCSLDLMERSTLINFFVLLVSIALITVLDGKELLSILAFALAGQAAAILGLEKSVFLLQQSIVMTVCAAVVSQILFHSYISSKIAQKRLKAYAQTDALTGLPNRRGLEEWMMQNRAECIKRGCQITIGLVDIDDFKEYNDAFGHLEGDACLKYVADCIQNSFAQKAGIVSRFGGEEFIIILKDITEEEAIDGFVKIKSAIGEDKGGLTNHAISRKVTISIGVAFEQVNSGTDFNQILRRADNALYKAKRSGKNLVVSDNGKSYR